MNEEKLLKLIDKCFDFGQGGWNSESNRKEYTDMALSYYKELNEEPNEDKLKKYAEYRFELWSLLAEKSCIILESELDEIQYLVSKNREYIEEAK